MQGYLTFEISAQTHSTSQNITFQSKLPPQGTFYSILHLDQCTLSLHRGNPYHTSHTEQEDGSEVAKVRLLERGWTGARRAGGNSNDNGREFELFQEKSSNRKGSSSGLGFAEKIALKMKRSKSISATQPIQIDRSRDSDQEVTVDPLIMYAESSEQVGKWIEAFNKILSIPINLPSSPKSTTPATLSQSPSFSTFSLASRRPSKHSPSLSTIPLSDVPTRRPSFLSQPPPPSPRTYSVTLTEPSPPPKRRQSSANTSSSNIATTSSPARTGSVPDWISSVKSSTSIPSTSTSTSTSANSPLLKSKRSLTSFANTISTAGPSSTSMERSRSDGRSSIDSRVSDGNSSINKKLFGFLGNSKKSKKEAEGLNLIPTSPRSAVSPLLSNKLLSPPLNTNLANGSTTSLSDSLLSEIYSGGYGNDSICSSDIHSPFINNNNSSNLLGSLGLDNIPLSPPPSANPQLTEQERNQTASIRSKISSRSSLEGNSRNPIKFLPPPRTSSSIESRNRYAGKTSSDLMSLESQSTHASEGDNSSVDVVELIIGTGDQEEEEGEEDRITDLLVGRSTRRLVSTSSRSNMDVVGSRRRNGMLVDLDDVDLLATLNFDHMGISTSQKPTSISKNEYEYNKDSVHIINPQDLIAQMALESGKNYNGNHHGFNNNDDVNNSNWRSLSTKSSFTQYGEDRIKNSSLPQSSDDKLNLIHENFTKLPTSISVQTLSSTSLYGNNFKITSSPSSSNIAGKGLSPRTRNDSRQGLNTILASGSTRNGLNLNLPSSTSTSTINSISVNARSNNIPRSQSATTGWFDSSRTSS